jgi:hypothetical protein
MKNLLAAGLDSIIGTINAPVNDDLYTNSDVNASLGKLISTGIQIFFFVAALAALLYMLLGAFDWITSNGEKEKLLKAQNKIQSAAIGVVLIVFVLVVFNVIMGTVLGGKFGIGEGFTFRLPSINSSP